ncbi:sucrose-6-phosphate hydrolase [Oceanobacillus chungangensis]|uniref:Sucrose-6-phosphate hydrolase n=1 Tax=Oceanobacillus chungangensis TaxID=1229152 RepID=A0A3D8PRV1_9BACI|nr:sucrose-6-phosphate hydrolase [Oceanobacillus chungangensis]RDW18843.1 sucrose-6-phosphate hydrolase [Oceanobacillus chungangensis]
MKLITEWTTPLRYKPYHQWPAAYQDMLESAIQKSDWKQAFHIQPKTGLLNDPNGFSFYDGKWHLFYQAYPFGPVHGVKSWYHMVSDNLVDWEKRDYALLPDSPYDSHGVYSGSAITVGDKLFLMYTGNVRDERWERHSYQLGAWMDSEMLVEKITEPLIENPPTGYTDEFRDPQVFRYQDQYLMAIGAQTKRGKGAVLVYQSKQLTDWELLGELDYTTEEMGFMVECPNLVFVDNQPVLLFCPQGLDQNITPYQNIYPNMYVIGSAFNKETVSIENTSDLVNLDEGFDVYATQAFNAPDDRVLSIGWIGLPELDYPSFEEGWAHCLSIVKELSIKDQHLYQKPVAEMQVLRQNHEVLQGSVQDEYLLLGSPDKNVYELKLELDASASGSLYLFADKQNTEGLKLSFDAKHDTISMDRSKAGIPFGESYGSIRTATLKRQDKLTLHIFVDRSVCEVFVNDGYCVMTSCVFIKDPQQTHIFLHGFEGNYTGDFWTLRDMN